FSSASSATLTWSPTLTSSSPSSFLNCSIGTMPSDLRPALTTTTSERISITSAMTMLPGFSWESFSLCSNSSAKLSVIGLVSVDHTGLSAAFGMESPCATAHPGVASDDAGCLKNPALAGTCLSSIRHQPGVGQSTCANACRPPSAASHPFHRMGNTFSDHDVEALPPCDDRFDRFDRASLIGPAGFEPV